MTLPVMPNPKVQFFDDNGDPLSGGKLYSYESGTSTPKATYTTAEGTTANANPVVLDSRGEAAVFLSGRYKLILKDSDDVQIWSVDDISLMPYTTVEQSEWVDQNLTLTYSSATVFTVPGDVTATFPASRRVKATVSAGTIYGVVKSSAYTTLTTVTVVLDSGSLDSGLSDISVGLIMPTNTAFPNLYALPRYTTTQKNALTPLSGMALFDTTTDKFEGYSSSAWRAFLDSTTSGQTIVAPTIADFTNAPHDHGDADDGGVIVWQGLPDGAVVQVVTYQRGDLVTGATVMPYDDTIPQNTEGNEFLTVAITPKATTHKLIIEVTAIIGAPGNQYCSGAIFQDATAGALAAGVVYHDDTSTVPGPLVLRHVMTAGTTSATTFDFRAGADTGSVYLNGNSAARIFGGVCASSITITEIKSA